jgi:hypothetical protein
LHHSKTQFPSKSIQVSSKIGWDSIPSKSFKVFDQSFLWPLSLSEKSFKNFDNDNRPLLKCAHIYWFNINRKQKIRGKTNRVTKNNFKIVDVIYSIYILITPYIRMLDSDWLIAVIFFFTNSGLALWICRIFASCRCICIRLNFFSWYLQNRICRFYPSPRRL